VCHARYVFAQAKQYASLMTNSSLSWSDLQPASDVHQRVLLEQAPRSGGFTELRRRSMTPPLRGSAAWQKSAFVRRGAFAVNGDRPVAR
jgi:hypothetical protein